MVLYNCEICNYNTIRRNQYQRHLSTKKHIKNVSLYGDKSNISISNSNLKLSFKCPLCSKIYERNTLLVQHLQDVHIKELSCPEKSSIMDNTLQEDICHITNNETTTNYDNESMSVTQSNTKVTQNVEQKNYVCEFCGKDFKHSNSYYRHLKHYCKNKRSNDSNINMNANDYKDFMFTMVDKILEHSNNCNNKLLEEKDKSKYELLAEKEKSNNLFLKVLEKNSLSGSNNIINQNNTLNNSNYVLQFFNYSEADSMDFIKDKFKLTREEFIKASLTYGYRGALLEKAENIIIKPYLKTQFKRPMHTVDCSRKKALYKDEDHTKWTFNPKTTLTHCFEMFHKSALEHQDQTIKENPNWVIESIDDSLYKQTYFIPTENKTKESIYKEVQNHIYKETKVNRKKVLEDFPNNLIEIENDIIKENDDLISY